MPRKTRRQIQQEEERLKEAEANGVTIPLLVEAGLLKEGEALQCKNGIGFIIENGELKWEHPLDNCSELSKLPFQFSEAYGDGSGWKDVMTEKEVSLEELRLKCLKWKKNKKEQVKQQVNKEEEEENKKFNKKSKSKTIRNGKSNKTSSNNKTTTKEEKQLENNDNTSSSSLGVIVNNNETPKRKRRFVKRKETNNEAIISNTYTQNNNNINNTDKPNNIEEAIHNNHNASSSTAPNNNNNNIENNNNEKIITKDNDLMKDDDVATLITNNNNLNNNGVNNDIEEIKVTAIKNNKITIKTTPTKKVERKKKKSDKTNNNEEKDLLMKDLNPIIQTIDNNENTTKTIIIDNDIIMKENDNKQSDKNESTFTSQIPIGIVPASIDTLPISPRKGKKNEESNNNITTITTSITTVGTTTSTSPKRKGKKKKEEEKTLKFINYNGIEASTSPKRKSTRRNSTSRKKIQKLVENEEKDLEDNNNEMVKEEENQPLKQSSKQPELKTELKTEGKKTPERKAKASSTRKNDLKSSTKRTKKEKEIIDIDSDNNESDEEYKELMIDEDFGGIKVEEEPLPYSRPKRSSTSTRINYSELDDVIENKKISTPPRTIGRSISSPSSSKIITTPNSNGTSSNYSKQIQRLFYKNSVLTKIDLRDIFSYEAYKNLPIEKQLELSQYLIPEIDLNENDGTAKASLFSDNQFKESFYQFEGLLINGYLNPSKNFKSIMEKNKEYNEDRGYIVEGMDSYWINNADKVDMSWVKNLKEE
ncbi:hypothetical protein ABK040_001976 [Willaertia magna]